MQYKEYMNYPVDQGAPNKTKQILATHSSTSDCIHQTSSSLYVNDQLVFIWDM